MLYYSLFDKMKHDKNWYLLSFVVSDLPMLLILSPYLICNWDDIIRYSSGKLAAIFLASFWTVFGPVMIVKWMYHFEHFCKEIDRIDGNKGCAARIREEQVFKNKCRNTLIIILWVCLVAFVLLHPAGCKALKGFCLSGYADINYWLFIVCVLYVVFQTSYFFLFLIFSWKTINGIVHKQKIMKRLLLNYGAGSSLNNLGSDEPPVRRRVSHHSAYGEPSFR